LKGQNDPSLVVISNFHEYITLETMIPALPIPPDWATLDEWLARIRTSRRISAAHPIFVLDPSNKWRSGWIAPPEEIVETFNLRKIEMPDPLGVYVFEPAQTTPN